MIENSFTQRGFYFLLGGIVSCMITLSATSHEEKPQVIKIEIHKDCDSVKVDTVQKKVVEQVYKPLTELNLKEELRKHDVPHSDIVLAQAKLETGNFKSSVCKTHNNLFGLRKGKRYRRYNHWSESVVAYKKHISNKYKGGNYYTFLSKLGYAEDPKYINKLKKIV